MRIRADDAVKQALREQLLILKGMGVKKVDVSYSGSGDEGYINGVVFTPELGEGTRFNTSEFEGILYDYLDPAHVGDWVNNEGGFGEISIDLETGKTKGTVSFNEVTYTTTKLTDQL
jgi:hypothetical protein